MILSAPLHALTTETDHLHAALAALTPEQWQRPTRCAPWNVAALTGHLTIALGRTTTMLDAPEPPEATVDARAYYRPDERFSARVNSTRVDDATEAAGTGGPALIAAFDTTRRTLLDRCARERPGRLVTTRHGDPMTLTDFLTTRVTETTVHGIDLADALDQPRWTTPEAAAHTTALLLGPDHHTALAALGWDPIAFIAKATGRDPFAAGEEAALRRYGYAPLAFG
ncbi:maleylpyruvate isomerase family mycothiol-dependent enzyme [Glycomyces sp. NPDC046736]|uniref:maleylpyruvate isomerase family mycothiol-dependent enzyme n=1 Tax=Glycomyces sp. NPDC046736 TaxID=3155615 RepID=UPI0033EA9DCA